MNGHFIKGLKMKNFLVSFPCRCGCAQMFRGIVIEGDECCKANTSGLVSQIPSKDDVEHVFTSFKNDVSLDFLFYYPLL
jgi:hypothetical protein